MLPSSNKKLRLELSPSLIRLIPPVGEPQQHLVTPSNWWSSLEQLLAQPDWRGMSVSVVLSNQLLYFSIQKLDAKLKDEHARQQFMAHNLSQLYGGNSTSWECRVFATKAGLPCLVAGIEKSWLQQLSALVLKNQLVLVSVLPLLAHVFNHHSRSLKQQDGWLVIYEPAYSLLVLLQRGLPVYCCGVHHHNLAELPQLLAREALLSPAEVSTSLIFLYAQEQQISLAGVQRLPNIPAHKPLLQTPMAFDFCRQGQPSRRAGWLLLLVGIGLFSEMLWSYQQLQTEVEVVAQAHELLPSPSRQVNSRQATLAPPEQAAWQPMLAQLQRPWPEFFTGLESIQNEDIAILKMQHEPRNQTIQLHGEARNYAALLTLVAELNNTPPFADATLLHHETRTEQAQQPVAFVLNLRWVQTK